MSLGGEAPQLALVTLDCRPIDIATSVSETDATVYSPAVLRLRDQPRRVVWDWADRPWGPTNQCDGATSRRFSETPIWRC